MIDWLMEVKITMTAFNYCIKNSPRDDEVKFEVGASVSLKTLHHHLK